MSMKLSSLLVASVLCTLIGTAYAADAPAPKTDAAASANVYPLDTCPVTGEKLGNDAVTKEIDGRPVKFCCAGCQKKFEADKTKYNAVMDEAITAKQKEKYPLDTCVVSGEKLAAMGKPVLYVHQKSNQLVEFCCKDCVKTFEKEPEKYLKKLDAARAPKTPSAKP